MVAHQSPPFLGFSRQEYWSGLLFSFPGDLSDPGIEPGPPELQTDSLPFELPGEPILAYRKYQIPMHHFPTRWAGLSPHLENSYHQNSKMANRKGWEGVAPRAIFYSRGKPWLQKCNLAHWDFIYIYPMYNLELTFTRSGTFFSVCLQVYPSTWNNAWGIADTQYFLVLFFRGKSSIIYLRRNVKGSRTCPPPPRPPWLLPVGNFSQRIRLFSLLWLFSFVLAYVIKHSQGPLLHPQGL